MKRQLLAGCAAAALTVTPALAQPFPSPIFNWTGFYFGPNVGYSWGNGPVTYNEPAFSTIPAPTSLSSPSNLDGVIGGGQVGFNWQVNTAWVAGLETDLQGASESASRSYSFPIDSEGAVFGNLASQIMWFGTLRARAGWLVTPTTLVYATGGFAYGKVNVSGSFEDTHVSPTASWSFNQSAINTGWTVGGGIEVAFPGQPNVTWRIEYLYLNLGSLSGHGFDSFGDPYSYSATFTDNVLRLGLNWKIP